MNKELLEQVENHIREHPENYDQETWFYADGHGQEVDQAEQGFQCETTCCVAGTAAILAGNFRRYIVGSRGAIDWHGAGQEALGLDDETVEWLFNGSRNPDRMPDVLQMLRKGETLANLKLLDPFE